MKIQTDEYEAAAYLALPDGRPAPGVLVLHPWWGLNEDIKGICDRLAKAGFVALAPDLYDGRIATTIEEAEEYSGIMDKDMAQEIIRAATEQLLAHEACKGPQIGVIGFSLGGMYGVWIAHAGFPERNDWLKIPRSRGKKPRLKNVTLYEFEGNDRNQLQLVL